jgi:uncharacterized RDD family membrane protein YckC
MAWFYADGGRQVGPVEEAALDDLVRAGIVRDDTLVWRDGMANWQPHGAVRGVRVAAPPMPATPLAATPMIGADSGFCSECGRPYPMNQLVMIGNAAVCAQCKPLYMQRVREGGQAIGVRRYAGFWIRFVARVIDAVILGVVAMIIRIPLGLVMVGPARTGDISMLPMIMGLGGILALVQIAMQVAYEVYFLSTRGATLGKQVLGLKVIRNDGSMLSAGQAAGRFFAQWLSAIIFFIGYIMAGFDPEKRALHDRICDTRVIYAK